jgi:mono/diheme cytochrome c family protein
MKKMLLGLCCLALLAACGPGSLAATVTSVVTPTVTVPPRPALDPELVALGETIYVEHCAECHGKNLEGEPGWQELNEDGSYRAPAQDVTGHTWQHEDIRLVQIVKLGGSRVPPSEGVSNMPAYATILSDREIAAVLAFIKSSWPPEVQQVQWEVTMRRRAEE